MSAGGSSLKSIRNRFVHLTNYSVNKKNDNFVVNKAADRDDEGSKWSLTALYRYLESKGVDVLKIQREINEIAVKALIAGEPSISSKVNQAGRPRYVRSLRGPPHPITCGSCVPYLWRQRTRRPADRCCAQSSSAPLLMGR